MAVSLLQAQSIQKTFGTRTLFHDVTFQVYEQDRIGLVGRNGCGKSTLLSILEGREEYDSGSVIKSKNCVLNSIEQILPFEKDKTLYEITLEVFSDLIQAECRLAEIAEQINLYGADDTLTKKQYRLQEFYEQNGGLTFRSRTRSTLLGLGFSTEDLDKKAELLSGGETRKAQLAAILLSKANLLILDEPTNHLDLFAIHWLENFLSQYKGAYIIVSHDRYFLDRLTNKTMELSHETLTVTNGNYSRYLELKSDRQLTATREYERKIKEIHRLESIIEQQKRWNQERNYITIASKQKQIDRIQETLVKPEKEEHSIRLRFTCEEPISPEVLEGKNLCKSYGSKVLFKNADFLIKRGEHVCLIGPNGCGKTTFLKILLNQEAADSGTFRFSPGIRCGYFEQSVHSMQSDKSILEYMNERYPRLENTELRNLLARFLFTGDSVFKSLRNLSGGELSRIRLLELMMNNYNFLFLDEPTNYLDIASREQLEDALSEYNGTMLVVTHDRYFIERIADRILILDANGIREFDGDWDTYLNTDCEFRKDDPVQKPDKKSDNTYLQEKARRAEHTKVRMEMTSTEKKIKALENEIAVLEKDYYSPENPSDYMETARLSALLTEKHASLDTLYEHLFELDEKLSGQE